MNRPQILIDTDAIIALTVKTDSNHKKALQIQKLLESKNADIKIINLVLHEIITVLSYKVGQKEAINFLNKIKENPPKIIFIDEKLENLTYQEFLNQNKKGTSFIDCSNMAVMKYLNITKIFSFDKIYKRNGFELIVI